MEGRNHACFEVSGSGLASRLGRDSGLARRGHAGADTLYRYHCGTHDYGAFLSVPAESGWINDLDCPDDLKHVLRYARQIGCDVVRMDQDGTPKSSLRYIHCAERARSTLAERAASVAVAGMQGNTDQAEDVPLQKRDKARL